MSYRYLIAVVVALSGCAEEPRPTGLDGWTGLEVEDASPDVETAELPEAGACGEALVVREVRGLPGGLEVFVQLTAGDTPVALESMDGAPRLGDIEAVASSAWQPTGLTGLVVAGPDARAAAFLRALPEGETVLVWHGGTLVAEAGTDREHAARRVEALTETLPLGADLALQAELVLRSLGGPLGPLDRTLVVAAPAGEVTVKAGRVRVMPLGEGTASALTNRRAGLVRVAACSDARPGEVLALRWAGLECELVMPAPPEHLAGQPCALAGPYPGEAEPRTIELVMTPAEAELAATLGAANSRDEFTLSVRLGAGEPIAATARYRGHTSLECERKSYAIDLTGPEPRRFMAGAAHDELFLISMCRDSGYFNQLFGNRLARELGLFPLEFEIVRVVAAGRDLGAYLLLEDPEQALRQDMSAPWAILRRRFDPELEPPDVDFAVDEAQALATWDEVERLAATGELSPSLDADAYLRWVALNTFLENEDWVDEVFFHAALEGGVPYFRVMAWDPDDLFSPCHHQGRFAFDDPHDLLYCAEGDLEKVLLASPVIYERFVQHLEALLDALDESHLATTMAEVRRALFAVVASDDTAAAMIELAAKSPEAKTAAGFQAVVTRMMDDMLVAAERSRAGLRAKIKAYREATP